MVDYAQQLHKPLGIQEVKWNQSPLGITMGGGGTRYRSRDFLKIGQLLVKRGQWNGQSIINPEWIQESFTPRTQVREGTRYGYQWWNMRFQLANGEDYWLWAAAGNGGNYLFIDQNRELVVLITSQAYNTSYGHSQSQEIMREFILPTLPTKKAFQPNR